MEENLNNIVQNIGNNSYVVLDNTMVIEKVDYDRSLIEEYEFEFLDYENGTWGSESWQQTSPQLFAQSPKGTKKITHYFSFLAPECFAVALDFNVLYKINEVIISNKEKSSLKFTDKDDNSIYISIVRKGDYFALICHYYCEKNIYINCSDDNFFISTDIWEDMIKFIDIVTDERNEARLHLDYNSEADTDKIIPNITFYNPVINSTRTIELSKLAEYQYYIEENLLNLSSDIIKKHIETNVIKNSNAMFLDEIFRYLAVNQNYYKYSLPASYISNKFVNKLTAYKERNNLDSLYSRDIFTQYTDEISKIHDSIDVERLVDMKDIYI